MKLVLIYTFWSGDDHQMLIDSIEHHKPFVNEIFISFQSISNKGEYAVGSIPLSNYLLNNNIKSIIFVPDLAKSTKENERLKHNQALHFVKQYGATHFILSAADHFYKPKSFKNAIDKINEGFDVTLTRMFTYYKNKNWALFPIETYYMPFICELKEVTTYENKPYPVVCDPSVKVFPALNICVMTEHEAIFDHYSMVRNDVKKKFRNAAASIRWKEKQINQFIKEFETAEIGSEISYFDGRKIVTADYLNGLYNY